MKLKIDEQYVVLCLALDNILGKGTLVDCFFGNKDLYKYSEEFVSIDEIRNEFVNLLSRITFVSDDILSQKRKEYLEKHIQSILCQIDIVTEHNKKNYIDTINTLLDINIEKPSINYIEKLYCDLTELLFQFGYKYPKDCIVEKWNEVNLITGVEAISQIKSISENLRMLSISKVINPVLNNLAKDFAEKISVNYTAMETDKGWSAYNFYNKNYCGNVSLNSYKYFNKMTLTSLVAHESYPGHHTEFAIKEYKYNYLNCDEETTIAILNSPSCTVSEGIAECGLKILGLLNNEENMIDMKYRKLVKEIQYYMSYNTFVRNKDIDLLLDNNKIISKVYNHYELKRFVNFMHNWKYYVPVYKYGAQIIEKCDNVLDLYTTNLPSYYRKVYGIN